MKGDTGNRASILPLRPFSLLHFAARTIRVEAAFAQGRFVPALFP